MGPFSAIIWEAGLPWCLVTIPMTLAVLIWNRGVDIKVNRPRVCSLTLMATNHRDNVHYCYLAWRKTGQQAAIPQRNWMGVPMCGQIDMVRWVVLRLCCCRCRQRSTHKQIDPPTHPTQIDPHKNGRKSYVNNAANVCTQVRDAHARTKSGLTL
jgi:hypothetical protein